MPHSLFESYVLFSYDWWLKQNVNVRFTSEITEPEKVLVEWTNIYTPLHRWGMVKYQTLVQGQAGALTTEPPKPIPNTHSMEVLVWALLHTAWSLVCKKTQDNTPLNKLFNICSDQAPLKLNGKGRWYDVKAGSLTKHFSQYYRRVTVTWHYKILKDWYANGRYLNFWQPT